MDVTTVQSAKEALGLLDRYKFDIIFMDHMMPEMDGIEAIGIMRNIDEYKQTPIVALTANAVNGAREMFLNAGFNEFLPKPIEVVSLDKILREWLPANYIEEVEQKVIKKDDKELDSINNYSYIDVSGGVSYSGGNKEMYYEILEVYVDKTLDKMNAIDEMYNNKDWKNYTINVHSLKGTSKTIGADELAEVASKLEIASKEGEISVIETEHPILMELIMLVVGEGIKVLEENGIYNNDSVDDKTENIEELEEISKELLEKYIMEMYEYCDMFDSDEIVAAADNACKYVYNGRNLSKYFLVISTNASNFKYKEVKQNIDEMVNELNIEIRR
jgi:CheY-like chemotaxis protein